VIHLVALELHRRSFAVLGLVTAEAEAVGLGDVAG
jgi:hypothetical protein